MDRNAPSTNAKFHVGQIVHHRLFDYRGVIVDVDPCFHGTEEWYTTMARSHPPRERPWYHVLVDEADYRTYVAERNLEADDVGSPIRHPDVTTFFERFEDEHYVPRARKN